MKNSIFNAVCKTRYLALLVVLIFTCGNAWGAEEVYKTALFGSSYNSSSVSDYTSSWSATNNSFTVNLVNFNNNQNGWNYVKCGRKNNTSTGTITTAASIDDKITKVSVTIDALTASKVNSIKLYTSTNGSSWTERGSFSKATGAQTVTIAAANQAANLYYKVEFDCASGSSNGLVTVSRVDYYHEASGGSTCATPTFSPAGGGSFCGSEDVTLSCATDGATIRYTTNGNNPTESSAAYSSAIHITATTTIKAKAFKNGYTASEAASATYTKETPLTTMDAIYSAATTAGGTATATCITFNNWVVSGASSNGHNVYVTDGSKGFIIFGNSDTGFRQGDILSGTVSCNIQLYNQSAELTDLTTSTTGLTVTKGGSVTPVVKNASEIASLTGAYTGIVITTTGEVETCNSNKQCINGAQLYNQLYNYAAVTTGNTYTATGVYLQHGGTHEILPLSNLTEVSYTITAVSNNNSYGTVSLTGNVITASPVSGYRVSTTTAYNVTSGSATVVDNGDNTFTVTPSSDCTVRINFEAIPTYTVTLKDNDETLTQASAGASVTLPSRTGCDGYTFAGWTKTWTSPQSSWTTTAPTIIPAGSYTPTADENLYPVYTKTEESGGGGEPTAYSVGDVGDYVLAALNKNDSKWYAIPTSPTLTSGKIDGSEITVNESAGGVNYVTTSNASGYTWTIAKSGSFYTISDGTSYLYHATGGASGTNLEYGNSTDYIWSITNDNGLVFAGVVASTSTTNTRGLLYQYNTSSNPQVLNKFGGYALSNKDGTAYSRVQLLPIGGGSTTYYISVPNCCTKYDVTLSGGGTVGGGTFSASVNSACEGATVTLSTNICSGYTVGDWDVYKTGASGTKITVTSNSFEMPAYDVTVALSTTAKVDHFKDAMHETSGYTGDGYAVSGCNQTVPNLNPTTPGSECEGEHYKFVGWVDEAHVASDGTLLTGYSIVAGGTTSWNATGTTYYAIWAKEL